MTEEFTNPDDFAGDALVLARELHKVTRERDALAEALRTIGDLGAVRLTHEGAKKRARAALKALSDDGPVMPPC